MLNETFSLSRTTNAYMTTYVPDITMLDKDGNEKV